MSGPEVSCPDGGACHHGCLAGPCFRVVYAEPLSGVYPGDRWPDDLAARNTQSEFRRDILGLCSSEEPCKRCGGLGRRLYSNTGTWHCRPGGIYGQAMTRGTCDACWGSGIEGRPYANLRELHDRLHPPTRGRSVVAECLEEMKKLETAEGRAARRERRRQAEEALRGIVVELFGSDASHLLRSREEIDTLQAEADRIGAAE